MNAERWAEGLRLVLELVREGAGGLEPGGVVESVAAAAPRNATFIWPGGTCHVARYSDSEDIDVQGRDAMADRIATGGLHGN